MEYPVKIVNRAKEIWLAYDPETGEQRSFDFVAKAVNAEFGTRLPKKTIHQWSQDFGWAQTPAELQPSSAVALTPAVNQQTDEEIEWNWQKKKILFLAELAGIAEECFAVLRTKDGQTQLAFRDAESAAKTGLACLETVGKLNSGKYDIAEEGDHLPRLDERDVKVIINFFITKGASPMPDIRSAVIEVAPCS